MASRLHRARQRRAEREPITSHGNLNLVPLVDILTSIVFFSLLTYTGAVMVALTAYDLSLPPVVVTGTQAANNAGQRDTLNLLLAVKVSDNGLRVEHSGNGGFREDIAGLDSASLDKLQALMTQIKQQYPQNSDVLVVPNDDVSYDDVVHVLERLRLADYTGISLGNRSRATQVAQASAPGR